MARNRMIRPEFWEDSKMAKLSPYARLFFIAMWNFSDDEGYLINDFEWLKAKCMPYDTVKVEKLLQELISLQRIEVKNDIIHIKNFLKYQKINRPLQSPLKEQFSEQSLSGHEPVNENSRNKEEVKLSRSDTEVSPRENSCFTKPIPQQIIDYGKEIGFNIDPQKFIDHYEARGWKYNKGLPMKDWKAAVRTWKNNGFDKKDESRVTIL